MTETHSRLNPPKNVKIEGFAESQHDRRECLEFEAVFPDSDHTPSLLSELPSLPSIAPDVGLDLVFPELRVLRRHNRMFRTSVPKTAIDEQCDFLLGEDKIRTDHPLSSRSDGLDANRDVTAPTLDLACLEKPHHCHRGT